MGDFRAKIVYMRFGANYVQCLQASTTLSSSFAIFDFGQMTDFGDLRSKSDQSLEIVNCVQKCKFWENGIYFQLILKFKILLCTVDDLSCRTHEDEKVQTPADRQNVDLFVNCLTLSDM